MIKSFSKICIGAAVLAMGFWSCDDDETYGDFSVRSFLEVSPELVSIHGDRYPLTVSRSIDTTYRYSYTERDTLKDANGAPVLGEDGEIVIQVDTIWYDSQTTARFTEYEVVELPSSADTFSIALRSNAQWKAPVPGTGGKAQWYYNYNIHNGGTSTSGGGDGFVDFRVSRNRGYRRVVVAEQNILTSDSTVFVRLKFVQKGERQKK